MFPSGYFCPSYMLSSYWERNGASASPILRGAGGQIVAERYRRIFRAMMEEERQRGILDEWSRMRNRQGKQIFEVVNHLHMDLEESNRKTLQRAAIFSALLAEV